MQQSICEFSNPQNYLSMPPLAGEPFAFQKMICNTTSTEEEIITGNDNNFVFYKNFNVGDVLILTFLSVFTIFALTGFLLKWVIPQRLNWKQH